MNFLADAASITSESPTTETTSHDDVLSPAAVSAQAQQKKKAPKLPQLLMQLLNDESVPDAIWWLPGEKEFAINADLFPSHVLDVHFPGSKYASFIRRLHKLGFSRQTRSLKKVYGSLPAHAVAFRHEKFRRDRPDLLDQLKNGYWKEAKARKQQQEQQALAAAAAAAEAEAASVTSSTASMSMSMSTARSPSPPAVVETVTPIAPMSAISLPEMISSTPTILDKPELSSVVAAMKPNAAVPRPQEQQQAQRPQFKGADKASLLLYLQQNLEEQRRVEERERQLLILMQQRHQQQQLELEHQLALRRQLLLQQQQQQQQQHQNPAVLSSSSFYSQQPSSAADLLRLQVLQHLQQQQQQHSSTGDNPNLPSNLFGDLP